MKDYIKKYCLLGWKVFPCVLYLDKENKVVKSPLIDGWKDKATFDFDEAIRMFDAVHAKAIGIATGNGSGITVLDVDVKDANDNGFITLENEGISLPQTPCSVTPTGGRHYIFKYTDQMDTSVKRAPGLDCRNDKGFIVVAPSIYPDGRAYEWIIDEEPWTIPVIDAPNTIINLLKLKNKPANGPRQVPEVIKAGERNDKLFKEACSMRERGYSDEEIISGLRTFNKTRCEKPVDDKELIAIKDSAMKYEKGSVKIKKSDKRYLFNLMQIMVKDEALKGLFGFNEFTNDISFLKAPPWNPLVEPYSFVSETDMVQMKLYVSTVHNYEPAIGIVREAVLCDAQLRKYHPVRDYLKSLVWDQKTRIDTWLEKAVGCDNNVYVKAVARKVLVGAVARVFNPGCKFDYMMVMEGDQGIGKSTLLSILGGQWYSTLGIVDNDKDSVEYMRGCWILEVEEMVCAKKTEVDHLKAFISRRVDRVRLPYAAKAENFPRQSILIGTLNQSGDNTYLRDDTGNRRFWPVLCRFIDQTWIRNNRTQLLAEAYDIYKNGNEDLFISNPEALEIAKQEQAERQSEDAWSHYLIDFFNRADCPGEITVDLIAEKALGIKADKLDKTSQVRIGIILRKLNIQSKRIGHNKIRTYYPIKNEKNGQKLVENNW